MKLSFFIVSLLFYIVTSIIITQIMNIKINMCRFLVCTLLIILFSSSSFILSNDAFLFASLLILPVHIVTIRVLFKGTKITSILYTYYMLILASTIISACIVLFTSSSQSFALFSDVIANVFILILCVICCYTNKLKSKIEQMYIYIPIFAKIIILLILSIFVFFAVLIMDHSFYGDTILWYNLMKKTALGIVLTVTIMIFYLLYATISNTRLKQLTENYENQISIQSEHYKKLASSNVDVRRFKHDFKNMSIAIEKLISDGNAEEALALLKESVNSFDNHDNAINPFKSGNPIADALLADKQKIAASIGATIKFDGAIPVETLSPTDVCVLLGNTLDNAIEACEKFPHNIPKTIHISANCVGSIAFIMIENPVTEKANIKNNHIKTSKKNKTLHGFGLYSLNSIVKKYSGTLKISSTESKFTVEMSLFFKSSTK